MSGSLLLLLTVVAISDSSHPSIIHVVFDQLGYNDVGWRNGEGATPYLDSLASKGVTINEFYGGGMSAPSRAAMLTGRYSYEAGYGNKCNGSMWQGLPQGLKTIPEYLKPLNYTSHYLGGWHLGWVTRNYTPTYRGFDTFFGSSENTGDYWWHIRSPDSTDCGTAPTPTAGPMTDLADVLFNSSKVTHADIETYYEDYSTKMYTDRAVKIINEKTSPIYILLSLHALSSPLNVAVPYLYPKFQFITKDARKIANGMLYYSDIQLSRIEQAFSSINDDNYIIIIHGVTGGDQYQSSNIPFRGSVPGSWEGSVRTSAIFYSPTRIDKSSVFEGMMHISDLLPTIVVGIVNSTSSLKPNGVTGYDLWNQISRPGTGRSTRETIIHSPLSSICNSNETHCTTASIRQGDFKLIIGHAGLDNLTYPPPVSTFEIPYGLSGGIIRRDTRKGVNQAMGFAPWNSLNTSSLGRQCHIGKGCLFNVILDPSESHDLSSDPSHESTRKLLYRELTKASSYSFPSCNITTEAEYRTVLVPKLCGVVSDQGFWLPFDWDN